jgi:molecular chaperone DnaJ
LADKKDYYDLLGVNKNAAADEIKAAYRRQAVKFHPDKNPGDKNAESQFKAINEAYEVLSDGQKRAAYDRFGHAGVNNSAGGGGPQGAGGFGGFSSDFGDVDLGDILGNIFGGAEGFSGGGGRRRSGQAARGEDIAVEADITLREAFEGTKKPIRVVRAERCETCGGSGAKPGTSAITCKTCGGAGQVRSQRGFFVMAQTCPTCRGEGKVIQSPCATCRGAGAVEKATTLTVKIPAGVREGTSLRISGAGQAGFRGGPAGDLFVVIHPSRDARYTREGDDLYVEEHISFPQAAMGCEISVATFEQPVTIKIPPGTQGGALFRLRDHGMPRLEARGTGDLFVKVVVDVPKDLAPRQRELLKDLAKSFGEDPNQYDESVLKKIFGRG